MLAKDWAWWMPVLLLAAWCDGARAVPTDPIALLVHEKRYGEATRAIEARLARNATDPAALAPLVDLRIAQGWPDGLPLARAAAERCIEANPDSSRCAAALGNALSAQSKAGGVLAFVRNARATRDAFKRALRIDPLNYRARVNLTRFYLDTPFFLGGSGGRARELATETQRTDPDLTRLMRAMCAFDEGKLADAEEHILAADLRNYALVQDSQHELLHTLATAHLEAGRLAQGSRLLQELSRRQPSSDPGLPWGGGGHAAARAARAGAGGGAPDPD